LNDDVEKAQVGLKEISVIIHIIIRNYSQIDLTIREIGNEMI